MHTVTHDPQSASRDLIHRSAGLNADSTVPDLIAGVGNTAPVARYVNTADCPHPPAPAWYLPGSHSVYIHVDEAKLRSVPANPWLNADPDKDTAKVLGLLVHEHSHAAISGDLEATIALKPKYANLITLLEELRVENHSLRRVPQSRKWLRASFGIILAGLPETYESKAHIVQAWTLTRGRTLAGVASPDETNPVDVAARTILGDDVVDGLTDLLQEALTLRTDRPSGQKRMIEICDEWYELVGEPPSTIKVCVCRRKGKSDEEGDDSGTTTVKVSVSKDDEDGDEEGSGGSGSGEGDEEGAVEVGGDRDSDRGDTIVEGSPAGWGKPGADGDVVDEDGTDLLDDEAAELMGMLARDLGDLMETEWNKDPDAAKVANSAEWAARVFGNRKQDKRLTSSQPTADDRREVTRVASVLSQLALPTVHKTPRMTEIPPGRLRTREALRGTAERSSGMMTSARPWRGTNRRHSVAKPLVVGVATDTSGSMRWAENAVARMAYVYTNAGHRIGARTAAVTFGSNVHRIARPGEVMDHVVTKSASDGTEQFDYAMAALNGVLRLTDPTPAARLLVVVSDGVFVKAGEADRAVEWLRLMDHAGTHVVWVTDRSQEHRSGFWLNRAARKFDRVSILSVEGVKYTGDSNVFNKVNAAVLSMVGRMEAH
jgi:hypothetical protein